MNSDFFIEWQRNVSHPCQLTWTQWNSKRIPGHSFTSKITFVTQLIIWDTRRGVWKSQKKSHSTFTIWVHKSSLKMVNLANFLYNYSLRSNSVTKQVNFNRTKIGSKCQKIQMRLLMFFCKLLWTTVMIKLFFFFPKWKWGKIHGKTWQNPFFMVDL